MEVLPAALPLTGPKGVFPGGAKGAALAQRAVDDGLIRRDDRPAGKGKKTTPYAVLTDAGIRWVIDRTSPKAALEALVPAVRQLGQAPPPPDANLFRAELEKATAACVGAIRESLAAMERAVLKAVSPPATPSVDPGR